MAKTGNLWPIFLVLLLAAGMYAGCSGVSIDKEAFKVDFPSSASPSGNPTFELATDDLPSHSTMVVYRVENPVVTTSSVTEIGRKLGFEGDASSASGGKTIGMLDRGVEEIRYLSVWCQSGAVEYGFTEPDKLYPPYIPQLPSDEEAKIIAYDFLVEAGLLPSGYGELAEITDDIEVVIGGSVGIVTIGTSGVTKQPTHLLVRFPQRIEGFPVTGPGKKLGVRIGDKGEVVRLLWVWRDLASYEEVAIKSAEEAFQELAGGKGSYQLPPGCDKVVIDQVSLVYWMESLDVKQDYVVPVYEFKGKCLDKDGKYLEEFLGWCEAVK